MTGRRGTPLLPGARRAAKTGAVYPDPIAFKKGTLMNHLDSNSVSGTTNTDSSAIGRREALTALSAVGLGAIAASAFGQPAVAPATPIKIPGVGGITAEQMGWDATKKEFILPPLPYKPEALEPHIDAQTMTIHHDKHHDAYVKGANAALKRLAAVRDGSEDPMYLRHWSRDLAFHASGHMNHCLFWLTMAAPGAGGGGEPTGELAKAIDRDFGGFAKFTAHFKTAAIQVEGSGWAWLCYHVDSMQLMVMQAEKQQSMAVGGFIPVLGVDVWEHAYYLKYQNKRKDYVDAFMNVVNWGRADEVFRKAMK